MITGRSTGSLCVFLLACSRGGSERVRLESLQADSVLGSPSAATTPSRSDTVRRYCSQGVGPLPISEDSIGPLELGMNIARLRAACPASRDSVVYGHETANAALLFPFDGLTVLAVQHEDSLMPQRPADAWIVRGSKGLVLGQVSLSAPWVEFTVAFGAGIVDAQSEEDQVTVMFCSHPRLLFFVAASSGSVALDDRPGYWNHNLSRIPGVAGLKELDILPSPNPTWHC